jgi:hypothetical protein
VTWLKAFQRCSMTALGGTAGKCLRLTSGSSASGAARAITASVAPQTSGPRGAGASAPQPATIAPASGSSASSPAARGAPHHCMAARQSRAPAAPPAKLAP